MKPDHLTVTQFNQHRKFNWLRLIARFWGFRKKALTLRLCILIADRFHTDMGHIEFSLEFAAEALDCDPSQIARARRELVQLQWLVLKEKAKSTRQSYSANKYDLGGGPEAIDLAGPYANGWVERPQRDGEVRKR